MGEGPAAAAVNEAWFNGLRVGLYNIGMSVRAVTNVMAALGAGAAAKAAIAQQATIGTLGRAARSQPWSTGNFPRGIAFENARGRNLPQTYPVIDRFEGGIATSIKRIDLAAKSYQNTATLTRKVTGYIDSVATFRGRKWGWADIKASQITGRALELGVPAGPISPAQQAVLDASVQYGRSVGVSVMIIPF